MRKWKLIGFIAICVLLLAGFEFKTVKLKSDKPLIDLEAMLVGEETGTPGSSNEGTSVVVTEDKEQKDDSRKEQNANPVIQKITIIVRDKTVQYKSQPYYYNRETDSIDNFEPVLQAAMQAKEVRLSDEYAEAHAYNYVLNRLRSVNPNIIVDTKQIVKEAVGDE